MQEMTVANVQMRTVLALLTRVLLVRRLSSVPPRYYQYLRKFDVKTQR